MRRPNYLVFHAIKESFDRLPTAVCFFDRSGGIVLCNRQMYRLSQYLLNSDMQYLEELQKALASPPKGIMPIASTENTYRFPDGLVWKFEKAAVTDRYGETYIQLTAADVTALHRALEQLAEDNRRLEQGAEKLRRLSENVAAVANPPCTIALPPVLPSRSNIWPETLAASTQTLCCGNGKKALSFVTQNACRQGRRCMKARIAAAWPSE